MKNIDHDLDKPKQTKILLVCIILLLTTFIIILI